MSKKLSCFKKCIIFSLCLNIFGGNVVLCGLFRRSRNTVNIYLPSSYPGGTQMQNYQMPNNMPPSGVPGYPGNPGLQGIEGISGVPGAQVFPQSPINVPGFGMNPVSTPGFGTGSGYMPNPVSTPGFGTGSGYMPYGQQFDDYGNPISNQFYQPPQPIYYQPPPITQPYFGQQPQIIQPGFPQRTQYEQLYSDRPSYSGAYINSLARAREERRLAKLNGDYRYP